MDNRLIYAVLFVVLTWMSLGTYVQATNSTTNANTTTNATAAPSNVTSAPNATVPTNMTTAAPSNATMAANMTTAAPSNATSAPNATMATNMTTAAPSNATMAANMTTAAASNATSAPNATMATNMTTAAASNATSEANGTMASNMTTAPATAAPPLTPNITVENLVSPISNAGCGTEQLCAAEPASCDPSVAGSCFFVAAKQLSGQNFEFGLSGESEGYLAATLSTDSTLGGNDTTYVCANDNGVVKFISTVLNDNGQLIETELPVNNVKGNINGSTIQCTFAATVPDSEQRASTLAVAISTGSYNSTSGSLGTPDTKLKSAPVDLTNVAANVTNEVAANATSSPDTTANAIPLQHSLTQALLISAGVLTLTML